MNKQVKNWLIILLVIVAIAGFFWIAKNLGGGESVESEKPAVICRPQTAPLNEQECLWTAHIHATVRVFKGGAEIPVKFEQGELEGQHTHSESKKLHWHGLIPVDPKTKEVTDRSALEVRKIITDFKLLEEGTQKFIVNNNEVDPSYIWKDGDTIEIRYE